MDGERDISNGLGVVMVAYYKYSVGIEPAQFRAYQYALVRKKLGKHTMQERLREAFTQVLNEANSAKSICHPDSQAEYAKKIENKELEESSKPII